MLRFALLFGFVASLAHACASAATDQAHSSRYDPAQAQLDLLRALEAEGYLSPDQATHARLHLVRDVPRATESDKSRSGKQPSRREALKLLTMDLPLANVGILAGLGFLFVGLRVLHAAMLPFGFHVSLLGSVPVHIQQAVFAATFLVGTVSPETIWAAQAFCVAALSAVGNLFVAGWVVRSHERIRKAADNLFATSDLAPSLRSALLAAYVYTASRLCSAAYGPSMLVFLAAVGVTLVSLLKKDEPTGFKYPGPIGNVLSAVTVGHLAMLCLCAVAKVAGVGPLLLWPGLMSYCATVTCLAIATFVVLRVLGVDLEEGRL